MKKKHQLRKKKHGLGHRNAAGPAPSRGFARRLPRRALPPDWKTTLAAVIGGGGSAALSGLIVNQKILSEEAAAIGMIGVGGATAYFADGNARVVGNSVASAGAGQLALALLARRAVAKQTAPTQAAAPTPAPAALPAPATPAADYRRDAFGGGFVTGLFRDAANELELLDDDEQRMGVRDADDGVDVYDLDDLAA